MKFLVLVASIFGAASCGDGSSSRTSTAESPGIDSDAAFSVAENSRTSTNIDIGNGKLAQRYPAQYAGNNTGIVFFRDPANRHDIGAALGPSSWQAASSSVGLLTRGPQLRPNSSDQVFCKVAAVELEIGPQFAGNPDTPVATIRLNDDQIVERTIRRGDFGSAQVHRFSLTLCPANGTFSGVSETSVDVIKHGGVSLTHHATVLCYFGNNDRPCTPLEGDVVVGTSGAAATLP